MQKTFASLLVTLAVSVMGIPVAYLVGQRSAEHEVQRRLVEERARARAEQQALISDLRAGLAPPPAAAPPPADSATALPEAVDDKLAETVAPVPISPTPAEQVPAPGMETAAPTLPAIPRDTFEAVALGADYPEVAQKFGREGVAALTMEDDRGSLTRQYVWQWIGPEGEPGRATLRFVDGSLTEKNYSE